VLAVPIEVAPPKYVVLVNTIQQRIEDGSYPVGSKIPSETELIAEFGASRPIVVRALGILAQDGWIEAVHGLGRFAKGRPLAARTAPEHAVSLLDRQEKVDVQILAAGPVLADARTADALRIDEGTPVIARRRLVTAEAGPVELATVYLPVEVAAGSKVSKRDPIAEGLLAHLTAKGVDVHHGTERITARTATSDEAKLLEVGRRDCLLAVLVVVHDATGEPVLAVDALIPPARHELESTFPIR
jgi:GntR family transcriptional regulator